MSRIHRGGGSGEHVNERDRARTSSGARPTFRPHTVMYDSAPARRTPALLIPMVMEQQWNRSRWKRLMRKVLRREISSFATRRPPVPSRSAPPCSQALTHLRNSNLVTVCHDNLGTLSGFASTTRRPIAIPTTSFLSHGRTNICRIAKLRMVCSTRLRFQVDFLLASSILKVFILDRAPHNLCNMSSLGISSFT